MAIDMTTVKQIMHNNKEVAKIEDGLGNVLWQKVTGPEWHTIWSGSAWAKRAISGNKNVFSKSTTSSFYTLPTTYTKFRFTFTISWGGVDSSCRRYVANWTQVDSLPSPYVIDNPRTSVYLTLPLLMIEYHKTGATSYN